MIEKLQYINHQNEVLDFGENGLYVAENDLRNYRWKPMIQNNKISGFKKEITSKLLPIIIKTENDGVLLKNRLFEIFEKDVIANTPGKIVINGYYLKCFITDNTKSDYMLENNRLKTKVNLTTDFPWWVKESVTKFNYAPSNIKGTNLDYNRDYPYDYASNMLTTALNNTNFVPSNFRLIIYGPCEDPAITIAGHLYKVKTSIASNEFVVIDSTEKTIIKTLADGKKENCFNNREKTSYVFEKIPTGRLNVSSSADFKFDVILLEERSEPKWI